MAMRFDDLPVLGGGHPLVGHLLSAREDPLILLRRVSEERGDLLRVPMPGRAVGAVLSPAALHDVLVARARSFEKSPVLRTALEPLAGQGLFTSEGELWRKQRKLMAPLFQQRELERYAACMRGAAAQGARALPEGAVVDVARETTRITMSIAGRALFDTDTFGEADELGAAITTALAWIHEESVSLPLIFQTQLRTKALGVKDGLPGPLRRAGEGLVAALEKPFFLPGERSRRMREALAFLDRRVERMIADRRASGLDRSDLLTALLRARDEDDGTLMSDKQVRDEILTLFIAGHETTASGLAWSLYLLARHPDALARVRAEVDALEGREIGFTDLPGLGQALQVFKEALRLYPPIAVFGRQAIADVEVAGCSVPRGTVLLVSPYTVHRRPEVWPDPERFDPDRFTPEAEAARPRCAYLPFSAGPRTCIGNHFALMEGPIVLATLLQHASFELAADRPIEPEVSATLRPKGGMPMRVRRAGRP
jgi:cytochrome P450